MLDISRSGRAALRTWSSSVAGGLFCVIVAIQAAAFDPLLFWVLYVIPIVVVGRVMGAPWGLAAGGLATALAASWARIVDADVATGGYLAAGGTFLVVGWLAGADAEQRVETRDTLEVPRRFVTVDPLVGTGPPGGDGRREALKLTGVGTWELDLATGETTFSEEYRDLYGVDPDRFTPSRDVFQEFVHREDREIFAGAVAGIIRDGTAVEVRYRIIRPSDGAERWIRSHIRVESDSTGRPRRVLGTGQDVTDLVLVLSPRESETLMLLAEGLSGKEIAARLVLSPATVRTHIQNAMVKLGAHTRGQAIAMALRAEEIGS